MFRSGRAGQTSLPWQAADGSGDAERLSRSANPQTPYAISPDGQSLVYGELDPKTEYDLFVRSDGSTRFLLITQPPRGDQSDPPQLNIVLNWGEELKRLVPVKK